VILSLAEISEALTKLEEDKVLQFVREKINADEDPIKILEACRKGMAEIGKGDDEIFLADLIMAGEIFNEAMEILTPKLMNKATKSLGKIVIGTVEGDIHNIGKDIVIKFLKAEGFKVIDLGVNVPAQKFIDAIKEYNPHVVGMSGLLTLSIEAMKKTIKSITAASLRDNIKIIIGGERADENICIYVGADAWVNDVIEGVKIIKKWIGTT